MGKTRSRKSLGKQQVDKTGNFEKSLSANDANKRENYKNQIKAPQWKKKVWKAEVEEYMKLQ